MKALLTEYRLERHADTLFELGVQCPDDLADLCEDDLEGFTVVEKRRYTRMSRARASGANVSTAGSEDESWSVASTSSWLSSNVSQSGDATVVATCGYRPSPREEMHDPRAQSGQSAEDAVISVRYCTVQPLPAKRRMKSIPYLNPLVCTLGQLVGLICEQEKVPGNLTAQLYTIDGVALSRNPVTEILSLSEWHIDDGSFFWAIFHSIDVEDDVEPPSLCLN